MKGISSLIDSDMEDSRDILDENSILSSSNATPPVTSKQKAEAKKTNKKRHRVTMPKPKSRVAKASPAPRKTASKKTATAKRKALEEQVDEEAEEEIQETQHAKPRGRAAAIPKAKKPSKGDDHDEMEADQTPAAARSNFAPSRATKIAPKVVSAEPISRPVKNTKPVAKRPAVEAQQEDDVEGSDGGEMELAEPARVRNISRQNSRIQQEPGFRRRAGSASDTERGDPNLRRKLGDITRKFENVDLKYRNLKEVGLNEANANMEKLRKQCDATTHASNELIASLKKELAVQAPLAQDARKLKKQIQTQEAEVAKLRATTTELATSLNAAQNEIKALQAKLAVARSSSVVAEGRTPARDAKREGPTRSAPVAATEAAQIAQMKEELYSDLTGLIVRSVKRGEDGDTYDCIQTGRNGTLHFKLFVDAEDAKNTRFEETDFLYTPLLDANRDRDMINLMPTYLTEEITFARQNAAKFYGRVLDTLTKRRAEDE